MLVDQSRAGVNDISCSLYYCYHVDVFGGEQGDYVAADLQSQNSVEDQQFLLAEDTQNNSIL